MKDGFVKVACATPSVRVADCTYNSDRIKDLVRQACSEGVNLLVLPRLCVTGSTCKDLFFHETLICRAWKSALDIASAVPRNMLVVFGCPVEYSGRLYCADIFATGGKIIGIVPDTELSYTERRFFSCEWNRCGTVTVSDLKIPMGNLVFACSDIEDLKISCSFGNNSNVTVSCRAEEERAGSSAALIKRITAKSEEFGCTVICANAGEGESTTDFVFAGDNVICENGVCLARQRHSSDSLLVIETDLQILRRVKREHAFSDVGSDDADVVFFDMEMCETILTRKFAQSPFIPQSRSSCDRMCEDVLGIQARGLKSRLQCSHSKTAVIGLSGGLDSTLALLVTLRSAEMLGWENDRVICVTMPCFGTSERTKNNAVQMALTLGCKLLTVDISAAVKQHFSDIGHDFAEIDAVYENSQARERTQVLMDIANKYGGLVVGTGDLSELALGWATYNGDHMSMYGVNAGVPKTLVRQLVTYCAQKSDNLSLKNVLLSVVDTPVSPELVPGSQETENIVGPYELHDFFLWYFLKWGFSPSKILRLARYTFCEKYDGEIIEKWLRVFIRRFFAQQFKRSCLPDGPAVLDMSLSPRAGFIMSSDSSDAEWISELDSFLDNR